ncbi:MAG TPA: hypothetical protein PKY82_29245 [Pyrinomonadaceae bacterium]|nr:hypothetical protein [Pyrinomonadaceae bacterium]
MSKRKTVIELQSKPENKSVRQIIEKTKPVEFAPINPIVTKTEQEKSPQESNEKPTTKTKPNGEQTKTFKPQNQAEKEKVTKGSSVVNPKPAENEAQSITIESSRTGIGVKAKVERLRIFQASTPVTRTTTKFQKAAIVVRGENGKQLIELSWRDQMNEKTKDIWDYLCLQFVKIGEEQTINEISIRKRDILAGSGVKSDRTFISAIYTLEDMGLIEVKRLSGNKEGNIYILTEEGREEIESYQNLTI